MLKKENCVWISYCISEMSMKGRTFLKEDEYRSLTTSEIIDSKRGVYLNVWKVLLQNTIR